MRASVQLRLNDSVKISPSWSAILETKYYPQITASDTHRISRQMTMTVECLICYLLIGPGDSLLAVNKITDGGLGFIRRVPQMCLNPRTVLPPSVVMCEMNCCLEV